MASGGKLTLDPRCKTGLWNLKFNVAEDSCEQMNKEENERLKFSR